jgi:hypothetical protein
MPCCDGSTNSIPPLDGEGVAPLGATGGVEGNAVDVVLRETPPPTPTTQSVVGPPHEGGGTIQMTWMAQPRLDFRCLAAKYGLELF